MHKQLVRQLGNILAKFPNLKLVVANTGWLAVDKFIRMGLGVFVAAWVARYLGTEDFGQLNFVVALVALAASIATLGMNSIIVRDLVKKPEEEGVILGTSLLLRLCSALIAMALITGISYVMKPSELSTVIMVAIVSSTILFKTSEVIKLYFESKVASKYVVLVETFVLLLVSGIKVFLILLEAPLISFIWLLVVESIINAAGLAFLYFKVLSDKVSLGIQFHVAKTLISSSAPLIISSALIAINMNIDKIMIEHYASKSHVGLYSAATHLYNYINAFIILVETSFFPIVVKHSIGGAERIVSRLAAAYRPVFLSTFLVVALFWIASEWILLWLYGDDYVDGAIVLMIYTLLCPIAALTRAQAQYFKVINKTQMIMWRQGIIVVINVVLNIVLIPIYGIAGAAIAILCAFIVAAIASLYIGNDAVNVRKLTFGIMLIQRGLK
ncbi:MAG: flippase [Pseudomonadota bacterium]|nr:flippase [Pseudomonadota bacterium]